PPPATVRHAPELLHVDVDELAGPGALVATDHPRGGSVHPVEPVQAVSAKDPVDRGAWLSECVGEPVGTVLGTATGCQDPVNIPGGKRVRTAPRSRTPIEQARRSLV